MGGETKKKGSERVWDSIVCVYVCVCVGEKNEVERKVWIKSLQ